MNPVTSNRAVRYLERLTAALADAPSDLREDVVSGVGEELAGLDEVSADARILELGDPALIASEALRGLPASATPPSRGRSGAYLSLTVALLVVGGYVLPGIGWIAALVLVGGSAVWTRREKTIAIAASVAVAVLGLALLVAFRGPELGVLALVCLLAVPFVGNVVIGIYLSLKWRAITV